MTAPLGAGLQNFKLLLHLRNDLGHFTNATAGEGSFQPKLTAVAFYSGDIPIPQPALSQPVMPPMQKSSASWRTVTFVHFYGLEEA